MCGALVVNGDMSSVGCWCQLVEIEVFLHRAIGRRETPRSDFVDDHVFCPFRRGCRWVGPVRWSVAVSVQYHEWPTRGLCHFGKLCAEVEQTKLMSDCPSLFALDTHSSVQLAVGGIELHRFVLSNN